MDRRVICFMAFLAVSVAASDVRAQMGAGNPREGLTLAQQVCSECHATRAGQDSPNSKSPTFVEIATIPGMTGTALTVALTTPHAGMPMFNLSTAQRDNIIAYVLSLKAGADD